MPGWGELIAFGGQWQISSWADFATFQLPRLIGGVAFTSQGLLQLDLAMRGAQLVTAPFFAFYPVVLPETAAAWARGGVAAVGRQLDRWVVPGAIAICVVTASALPLLPPALSLWAGRPMETIGVGVTTAVLLGFVAHASTGVFSGRARLGGSPIDRQLQSGSAGVGWCPLAIDRRHLLAGLYVGLGIALALPAAVFLQRAVLKAQVRIGAGHGRRSGSGWAWSRLG